MKPPGSRKEVQRLTGRIVAVNQFMANWWSGAYHSLKYSKAPALSSGGQNNKKF
jgi:hypothetical protein